jgi:hypothetical protein
VALDGAAKIIGAKGDSTYRGAVYLHAPAPPDEPDEPATPAYPATGELVNDSVIEHPSGAVLGAVRRRCRSTRRSRSACRFPPPPIRPGSGWQVSWHPNMCWMARAPA